ncbi:hypothetical protein DSO57_1005089 [Entomophthora muscae]|uniref:Uncharacterized protein n=1 Tax=Entomophthora muscae TaxID=34485 RepID=A0ACC2RMU1_9FUNG|nr:hypothetical protein DSO57_1005089 [Entomophthora muscae]
MILQKVGILVPSSPMEVDSSTHKLMLVSLEHNVKNNISILVLKTQGSNSGHQDMPGTYQEKQGPANLLSHRLELGDSPNDHQIATSCVLRRTQTYTEVMAYLKKVKMRPDTGPANEHQLPSVSSPDLATQLAGSSDVENRSRETEHHHFCFPELAKHNSPPLKPRLTVQALPVNYLRA